MDFLTVNIFKGNNILTPFFKLLNQHGDGDDCFDSSSRILGLKQCTLFFKFCN